MREKLVLGGGIAWFEWFDCFGKVYNLNDFTISMMEIGKNESVTLSE